MIWKTVRTFRLVRNRLAKEPTQQSTHFKLGALPREVVNMIEEQVTLAAYSEVNERPPLYFETHDCCDQDYVAFFDTDEMWEEFQNYAASRGEVPYFDDGDLNTTVFKEFANIPAYDALLDASIKAHIMGGSCDNVELKNRFFDFFALDLDFKHAEQNIAPLVRPLFTLRYAIAYSS